MLLRCLGWVGLLSLFIISSESFAYLQGQDFSPVKNAETEREFRERIASALYKQIKIEYRQESDRRYELVPIQDRFYVASRRVFREFHLIENSSTDQRKRVGEISTYFLSKGSALKWLEWGATPWLLFKQEVLDEVEHPYSVDPQGWSLSANGEIWFAAIQDGGQLDYLMQPRDLSAPRNKWIEGRSRKIWGFLTYSIPFQTQAFLELGSDWNRIPRNSGGKQPQTVYQTAITSDRRLVAVGFESSVLLFRIFREELNWVATYESNVRYPGNRILEFNFQGDQLMIFNAPQITELRDMIPTSYDPVYPASLYREQMVIPLRH